MALHLVWYVVCKILLGYGIFALLWERGFLKVWFFETHILDFLFFNDCRDYQEFYIHCIYTVMPKQYRVCVQWTHRLPFHWEPNVPCESLLCIEWILWICECIRCACITLFFLLVLFLLVTINAVHGIFVISLKTHIVPGRLLFKYCLSSRFLNLSRVKTRKCFKNLCAWIKWKWLWWGICLLILNNNSNIIICYGFISGSWFLVRVFLVNSCTCA